MIDSVKQESIIWVVADEVLQELQNWLLEREGKVFYARLKRRDILRLVRLRVWCFRYHIEIDQLLSLILPYLRKSLGSAGNDRWVLGCSIAALTGNGAEKILVEAIKIHYPQNEHVAAWREAERQHQLDVEQMEDMEGLQERFRGPMTLTDAATPQEFVASYRRRIMARRDRTRVAYLDPARTALRYRGSPWL